MQPVQNNRRQGLKELYLSDPVTYVQYQAYESQDGGDELMSTGILGPIQLTSAEESVAEPGETPTRTPTPAPTSDPTSSPASSPASTCTATRVTEKSLLARALNAWGQQPFPCRR